MSATGGPSEIRVLRHASVVLPDRTIPADVLMERGRIAALAPAGQGDGLEIWDVGERRVAAGLIDTHTHGAWGIDFALDPAERMAQAAPLYAAAGVTRLMITLIPGPEEEMLSQLREARQACRLQPSAFVGIHLEGPFLSRDRKGALPESGILPYDDGLMERILEAADGQLRIMTFAPEAIPLEAMERIQSSGVILSVGHTSADAATTRAAIQRGVSRATHLCNAMPAMHHRHPGPIVPLLLDRRVRTEVIVDGYHLDDEFASMIIRLGGADGVLAVSDSMPLAGQGPGTAEFAGVTVLSDGFRPTLEDGTLAGSVTPLLPALWRLGRALGLADAHLFALGSTVPAADLPLSGLGRVATGAPADLLILEADGTVVAALRGGQRADVTVSPEDPWLPGPVTRVR